MTTQSMNVSTNGNEQSERRVRVGSREESECGECGGASVVDSGGVMPWGEAAMIPCPECGVKYERPTVVLDNRNGGEEAS